jgi:outer membrane protein assembly factor BamE (lipoprotein component of BamABCDE complex)
MPYYVFRIQSGPTAIVKQLELIKEFEVYKEAQEFAKQTRASQTDDSQIKVMFAENQLQAEEQLMEKREKPILREWEK